MFHIIMGLLNHGATKTLPPSIIVESNSIIESIDAELAAYITRSSELIENLHHDEPACIRR